MSLLLRGYEDYSSKLDKLTLTIYYIVARYVIQCGGKTLLQVYAYSISTSKAGKVDIGYLNYTNVTCKSFWL